MIDWLSVVLNSMWILGLAAILGVISYHDWRAAESGRSLGFFWNDRTFIAGFACGAWLFCLGLAGLGRSRWETALWGVLSILFALQGWRAWRSGSAKGIE